MAKYIRPNCRPWCGTLSNPEWKNYRDLPSQKDMGYTDRTTYWKYEQIPYNGDIVQIWDSPACRDFQRCANDIIKENTVKEVWYLWRVNNGGMPIQTHTSESAARTEAERLCNTHGGEFIVCKAVASCKRDNIKWTELDPNNIPF